MLQGSKQAPQTQLLLQKNFNELIKNCSKMPSPKFQILEIYQNYLYVRNFQDQNYQLRNKIIQANEQAIYQQFAAFMHSIFDDLDKQFETFKCQSDLKKLDSIIGRNMPGFLYKQYDSKSNIRQKHGAKSSIILDVTPGNEQSQIQEKYFTEEKKVDLIFGHIFDKLHLFLAVYNDYYHLQHMQCLENIIYEGFYSYAQQNQSCFLNKNKSENFKISQPDSYQNHKQNEKKQKEKSVFMEELMDVVAQNINDHRAIKKFDAQNQPQNQSFFTGLQVGKYQINPLQIFGNAYSIFQSIYKKGVPKVLARTINHMRSKHIQCAEMSQEQQKRALQLAEVFLKSHAKHNISKEPGLNPDQFVLIEDYIKNHKSQDLPDLHYQFTEEQKALIVEILTEIIEQINRDATQKHNLQNLQAFFDYILYVHVKQFRGDSKIIVKKGIKTTLSVLNTVTELPNTFYLISRLFGTFQKDYCPSSRRLIIRIGHQIEQKLKQMHISKQRQYRKFSLTHAIKMLESQNLKRSKVCEIITNQKPFRESQLPLINQKRQYFADFAQKKHASIQQAQAQVQLQLSRIHIMEHKKIHKEPAKMELLKLTHSMNKKNVTVLISGFLSEDTNKFQEWMGVLQPTYDSEIYALKWESKTMEHILEYTINSCKDIALAGAGIGLIGGPYLKAVYVLKEIFTKYHQNPFNPCFQIATVTGIFLADLMMSLFDGHFINLVGFSLGTQVLTSALQRFKKKGKLHMINRIVTMGGVADKNQLLQILDSVNQDKNQPISIAWTNVYCETDNILRYLLRASMPSVVPVGLSQVVPLDQQEPVLQTKYQNKKQKIYSVDNINVTQFIDGHLTYRANMKTIARLIGMKDE